MNGSSGMHRHLPGFQNDDFAFLVEGAVMAPDVPQVDSNRDPDPGTSAEEKQDRRMTLMESAVWR
jgi:hypothetical protein